MRITTGSKFIHLSIFHKWQFGSTMNYVRYNFRALRSDASDPSKSPKHWQACSIIILITVLLPQFGMDFLHMYMNVAFDHIWVISGSIIRAGRIYNVSRSKNVCAKKSRQSAFQKFATPFKSYLGALLLH